jgi:CRP-like cAMP-binding protein
MPNFSNTAAVRQSSATMSPTVLVSNVSFISVSVMWTSVRALRKRSYDGCHMGDNQRMAASLDELLRRTTIFRRLSAEDRHRLAAVASVRAFEKGDYLFKEGEGSDTLYTVVTGRVKVFKTTARGADLILEIFGPGDPVGAVAVWESRPYPASATALEPTSCLVIARQAFFALIETHPSMVKGLLTGLTHRLVELTNRLAELSTGRIDARLARFFLKLADTMGQTSANGTFIPLVLSRQELADMIGTTIETAIRIMSRWGKDDLVRTEKDGFVVRDRAALEGIALS